MWTCSYFNNNICNECQPYLATLVPILVQDEAVAPSLPVCLISVNYPALTVLSSHLSGKIVVESSTDVDGRRLGKQHHMYTTDQERTQPPKTGGGEKHTRLRD